MGARLDIISAMLRITGEYAVDSELDNHPDVVTCRAILDARRQEEQSDGWWYNIVTMTLLRTPAGEIVVPSNTMELTAVSASLRVSLRDGKLYDNANDTFIFTQDVDVSMVMDLPEDEIPPIPLAVIKWLAVLEFAGNEQVTGQTVKRAELSLSKAEARLNTERFRKAKVNFNDTPMARRMFAFRGKYSTHRRSGTGVASGSGSKLRKT